MDTGNEGQVVKHQGSTTPIHELVAALALLLVALSSMATAILAAYVALR